MRWHVWLKRQDHFVADRPVIKGDFEWLRKSIRDVEITCSKDHFYTWFVTCVTPVVENIKAAVIVHTCTVRPCF